jgi:hypothetical protein
MQSVTWKAVAIALLIGLYACAPVRQRAPKDATVEARVSYYVSRLGDRRYVEPSADRDDPVVWHVAAEELGLIGISAIPALIAQLQVSGDDYERQQVFYALMLAVQHPNAQPSVGRDYPIPTEAYPPADAHAKLKAMWLSWWEARGDAVRAAAGALLLPRSGLKPSVR